MSEYSNETGEIVEQMTPVEAERITARIADKLDAIADNLEQVLPLIGEALTRRAWESLGYQSAQSYVSERFAASLSRLSPEVRRPVVAELSAAGMSTRQIAPIVGVQQPAVAKDLAKSRQVIPLESRHESVGSIDTPARCPSWQRSKGPQLWPNCGHTRSNGTHRANAGETGIPGITRKLRPVSMAQAGR